MLWREILVSSLLTDLIGPELAEQRYILPAFERYDGKLQHYFGTVERFGNPFTIQQPDAQERTVRCGSNTKVEEQLDFTQKIHIFAKEQDEKWKLDAVLIVSEDLYGLTYMIESTEEKLVLLLDYLELRSDHQRIVHQFLKDEAFRTSMIHFLGFVASNKLEQYYGFSEDIQTLVKEFNSTFAKKLNIIPVDHYLAETFLSDLIGDLIFLNPNSVTPFYDWPHFLAGYSLLKGCSIWQMEFDSVGEAMLNKSDKIPVHFLTAILSDTETDKLVRELIRYGKGKKKAKAGYCLLHIVRRKNLPNDSLKKIEKFLFKKGVPDHLLPYLPYLKENATAWDHFLKYITRIQGEDYANALCDMVKDAK